MFRSFLTSGLAQATQRIKYLFRDTFSVDASAPLGSPLACDVIGSWTVVDTENKLSKSGGKLVCAGGKATPAFGDPGIFSTAIDRVGGKAVFVKETFVNTGNTRALGFNTTESGDASIGLKFSGLLLNLLETDTNVGSYSTGTEYIICFVFKPSGGFWIMNSAGSWVVLYISNIPANTPLIARVLSYNSSFSVNSASVLQLPAPFNDDYGIATQRLAGARAAGDTFTHEADCLIEWTVTTRANGQQVYFRAQDASNYWRVDVAADGTIALQEVVSGSATSRGTGAAGTIANGQRMVVIADGAVIKVYANNVLKITYSSAANFQTATAGKLLALGTGGAVSDIVSWPRRLSGTALAVMERYSK